MLLLEHFLLYHGNYHLINLTCSIYLIHCLFIMLIALVAILRFWLLLTLEQYFCKSSVFDKTVVTEEVGEIHGRWYSQVLTSIRSSVVRLLRTMLLL